MSEVKSGQIELSGSALKVLEKRYLKKDEEGRVTERPDDLFRRVAKTVASVDRAYRKSSYNFV